LDAHLKVPDLPKDLRLPSVNAQTLQAMEIRTWRTTAGDIDVLLGIPADRNWNLSRFEKLRLRATVREVA
jgi:hypothetical protein